MRRACRIFLRILAALVILLVAAVLTSPWWLRFPLRWVAESNNATFATCETNGYSRLLITGLRADTPAAGIAAARIELDTPWLLVWRRFIGGAPGPITIDDWQVTLKSDADAATSQTPNPAPQTPNTTTGVLPTRDLVNKYRALAAPWLPELRLTAGAIAAAPSSPTIRIAAIEWHARPGATSGDPASPAATLAITGIACDTHQASATLSWDDRANTLALRATYSPSPAAPASASVNPQSEFRIPNSTITATLSADKLTAQLRALDNTAALRARFAPEGWMPAEILLDAPALALTAAQLASVTSAEIPPEYASATGGARIEYRDHRITADIAAHAEPAAPKPETPPIDIKLRAQGTREQLDLTAFDIDSPGFTAHLTAPVTLARGRRIVSGDTSLTIDADLSRQPWLPAQGRLTGIITLKGFTTGIHATARLAAENIRVRDIALTHATLNLTKQRRLTRLDSLELLLPDGTTLTASGQYDHATRTIAGAKLAARILPGILTPLAALAPSAKLPDGVAFDEIGLTLAASGPADAITFDGALEIKNARHPALAHPARLATEWRGRVNPLDLAAGKLATALTLDNAALNLATATTELRLAATDITPARATLASLDFRKDGASLLTLDAPADITWPGLLDAAPQNTAAPAITIAPLSFTGPLPAADPPGAERPRTVSKLSIQLAIPSLAFLQPPSARPAPSPATPLTCDITASGIPHTWFADLFNTGPLPWQLGGLTINARWSGAPGAPLTANVNLRARVDYAAQLGALTEGVDLTGIPEAAIIALSAALSDTALKIEQLAINDKAAPILLLTGAIPLSIRPGAGAPLALDRAAPLTLKVRTDPESPFWKNLAETLGVIIETPRLDIDLAGTLDNPGAKAEILIKNIGVKPDRWPKQFYTLPNDQPFPTISDFAARLATGADAIILQNLSLSVAGQTLTATGRIPFAYLTSALTTTPAPQTLNSKLQTLLPELPTFNVRIPDLDLAALSPYASNLIAPRGRLSAEFDLSPGQPPVGHLKLHDAALRPISPLGALKAITADASLNGRRLKIVSASALIGSQPITIAGTVDFPDAPAPAAAHAAAARRRQQISNPLSAFVITPNLTIKGANIPFIREPGLLLRADLNLKIAPKTIAATTTPNSEPGTPNASVPCIQGTITARESIFLYDIRTLWAKKPAEGPSSRPPFFSIDIPPFRDWLFDLDIRGRRFLRVQTAVFTGAISADFKLDGTLREPRLIGEARISGGKVLFPFATFATQSAVVRLTKANPHTPLIDFTATARAIGYDLRMSVNGTADSPVLAFTSSPALTSEQILYFIMAGEPPNNETDYSNQKRALSLGAYLGQNFINELFGLSSDEGRLTLSSGEKITREGRESYNIEYKLSNRWAAVGEYDEFDAYNFGLKWNVYTSRYRGQHSTRKTEMSKDDTPAETAPAASEAPAHPTPTPAP